MNRSRPFSKQGAYTESDNAPARNRVWPRETKILPIALRYLRCASFSGNDFKPVACWPVVSVCLVS